MNAAQVQCEPHDSVVLIKYEHRSVGGSWEEPVSSVRSSPLRRSQRLNSTLDSRTSGQLRNTLSRARELCERWRSGGGGGAGGGAAPPAPSAAPPPAPPPEDEGGGRLLSRWFSVRRGSHHQYDMHNHDADKMPKLPELEEELWACGGEVRGGAGRAPPPALPPPPAALGSGQLRRRHVVAAIMHSENSYVATLQRLLNDYKKPLEESSPVILNSGKVATLFHRLPDILQCHLHFRTALADCAATWDRQEKIGEVFLNAFSKAVVLDVYSDFINNFSLAMELAKQESKRKSALADFFKVKQISAHDRLSFFGLMVKPVQRFPQFIMFLQDLLKHTPPGHADRVALQRALTRLEALADALNERKRDAERTQAFRATLRRLGARGGMATVATAGTGGGAGRFSAARLLAARADKRHLLRQDDLLLLEFNQQGQLSKCKPRRLLLLNDLVVCVAVGERGGGADDTERLSLKWAYPVQDVDVQDTGTSPTLSRILAQGTHRGGSLRSNSSGSSTAGDTLCGEMSALMHDYETVSRMAELAGSLRTQYPELPADMFRTLLQRIQRAIQQKDDEMAWVDSCCLQLTVRGREEPLTFRATEPGARLAWATELRLAQLATAPANSPAWRLATSQPAPAHKMPLFVHATPVYSSKHLTEVRCGCFYTGSGPGRGGGATSRRARSLLWLCAGDSSASHVAVLTHRAAKLKTVVTLDLADTKITTIEFVKGVRQSMSLCGDTVWLGTDDRKILLYAAQEPEKQEKLAEATTASAVTQIKYHCDSVFVGLASGRIMVYRRGHDDLWALNEPLAIELGDKPVYCVLPVDGIVYASCAHRVFAINGLTAEVMRTLEVGDGERCVRYLAHSGVGLWTAFPDSTYASLYHTETFEHMQNIDIAADVAKTIGAREGSKPAHVSALLACQGLLWVGTTAGVSVTVPLPRLEGLPLVGQHAAVSHHAHAGPVTFLLSLLPETSCDLNVVRRNLSNARALAETVQQAHTERIFDGEVELRPKLERRTSEESSPSRPNRTSSAIVRRRKPGDSRLSKTLPKCVNLNACDVYGLYGDLMFVKDCVGEADVGGSGGDSLRRSDPELAAIPFRVNTLDRRLRMRAGRPRSLDLSSWSVDSRASSLCTSSGSEESMALRGVSRNGSGASRTTDMLPVAASTPDSASSKSSSSDRSVSRSNSANAAEQSSASNRSAARSLRGADFVVGESAARRSVLTIMGGRGYVDWRQIADASERPVPAAEPNPRDAHLVLWETRL